MRFEVRSLESLHPGCGCEDEWSFAEAQVVEDHGKELLCALTGIGDVWLTPRRIGRVLGEG